MWLSIGIVLATFFFMEFVAWFTHKYVMHGLLWFFHRDHHKKDHDSWFERNDFFFLIFAIPGAGSMFYGVNSASLVPFFYIGLGITIYGMAYFFVHDIFIHQRFKIMRRSDNVYFRAIRKAHKIHHKHLGKEQGECFGMLLVPWKYFKEARRMRA
jgi:beta-carotene 3-hydroxylase